MADIDQTQMQQQIYAELHNSTPIVTGWQSQVMLQDRIAQICNMLVIRLNCREVSMCGPQLTNSHLVLETYG